MSLLAKLRKRLRRRPLVIKRRPATTADIDRVLGQLIAARDTSVILSPSTLFSALPIDSIEVMELVAYFEEGLPAPIPDEELARVESVGDLHSICLRYGVTLPVSDVPQAPPWVRSPDPNAAQAFRQVGEVLDGLHVFPDHRANKVCRLVLEHDRWDIAITSDWGLEARVHGGARQRYFCQTAPFLVAEIMRLASVEQVDSQHHGAFGPGTTGGQPDSPHHTAVVAAQVWFDRRSDVVRISLRPNDFECDSDFPT